jgi:hypothetical protein
MFRSMLRVSSRAVFVLVLVLVDTTLEALDARRRFRTEAATSRAQPGICSSSEKLDRYDGTGDEMDGISRE